MAVSDVLLGLVCAAGADHSILSVLLAGSDSIYAWEHPLIRFFTMGEASVLRGVHSEFAAAVAFTRFSGSDASRAFGMDPWRDCFPSSGLSGSVAPWRACFPAAECLALGTRRALQCAIVYAREGVLAGLRFLDVGRACITDAAGARRLAAALPSMTSLLTLALFGNEAVGDEGMIALAAAASSLSALTKLDLGCTGLGDVGATALAKMLSSVPALTTLDVTYNRIGVAGVEALAAALPSLPALATLRLAHNSAIGPSGAAALAAALPSAKALAWVDLTRCNISSLGLTALAAAVASTPALKMLTICQNCIVVSDAAFEVEHPSLRALGGLELYTAPSVAAAAAATRSVFDFYDDSAYSCNTLFIQGRDPAALATNIPFLFERLDATCSDAHNSALGIATALKGMLALEMLVLSRSRFSVESMNIVAAALPCATKLRVLELNDSEINDECLIALAFWLPSMVALEALELFDNLLGDEGAISLSAAIPSMASLQHLDLCRNSSRMSLKGRAALYDAVHERPDILRIDDHGAWQEAQPGYQ